MVRKVKICLFVFVCFCTEMVFSQAKDDNIFSSFRQLEETQKDILRNMFIGDNGFDNSMIYGQEYYSYHFQSNTKPFLYYDVPYRASIIFNGKKYDNVILRYDANLDEVVYSDVDSYESLVIALNEDMITSFSFYMSNDTSTFYRLNEIDGEEYRFYEMPYNGNSSFAIKHFCSLYTERSIEEYNLKMANYLDVGDGFKKFNRKRQFIKIFGEDAAIIKSIINQYGISFDKKNKKDIAKILKEYDNKKLTDSKI